jgi:hypothetical protein
VKPGGWNVRVLAAFGELLLELLASIAVELSPFLERGLKEFQLITHPA